MIPPPKVELKFPGVDFVGLVYPRLAHPVLESVPRDILYCLVHNLVRNRARLHSQGRAMDPFCPLPECQGQEQDREHIFCSCERVSAAWLWVRAKLLQLLPLTVGAVGTTNEEFIFLQFPKDTLDAECVWLLGSYVELVDREVMGKGRVLRPEHVMGVLRSRLAAMRSRAVLQLTLIV